jgi:hypothetical protein
VQSIDDGANDGATDGAKDGATERAKDGATDGAKDGATDGAKDGATDGAKDGATDGAKDGATERAKDGATAYFLMDGPPARPAGHETAADAGVDAAAQAELAALLQAHADRTGSAAARGLLAGSGDLAARCVRVRPAAAPALSGAAPAPPIDASVERA